MGSRPDCKHLTKQYLKRVGAGKMHRRARLIIPGSTATYTVQANLPYNTLYYIRAYGIDPGGANAWSSPSTTGTFTTTPIPAPTNCQISATFTTGPAIVTWTDNLNIEDNYYIESSLDGGSMVCGDYARRKYDNFKPNGCNRNLSISRPRLRQRSLYLLLHNFRSRLPPSKYEV